MCVYQFNFPVAVDSVNDHHDCGGQAVPMRGSINHIHVFVRLFTFSGIHGDHSFIM